MDSTTHAVILGFIQGIAEFLPISSSGHLIAASWMLNGQSIPLTLNIALHLGTLVSVLAYFYKDWIEAFQSCYLAFRGQKNSQSNLLPSLVVGSIPAGIAGLTFKDQIASIFHHPTAIIAPLASVGFLLWLGDKYFKQDRSLESIGLTQGLIIGFAQMLALIPGVSRSGITILACRGLKLNRQNAARYSFMLGTPAMAGAALLEAPKLITSMTEPLFYIGFVVSMLTGILTIKFFMKFLSRFGFLFFALYRAGLAAMIYRITH